MDTLVDSTMLKIQWFNLCAIGVSDKNKGEAKELFDKIFVNDFPQIINDGKAHIQESQITSSRINIK